MGTFGLSPLLEGVIRLHPTTGEKINKLRKSYEGQIRNLALSGKNKPVQCIRDKTPGDEQPGPLRDGTGSSVYGLQDDGAWENKHPIPEMASGLFKSKLRKALTIQEGDVRDKARWDEAIGIEPQRNKVVVPQTVQPQQRPPNAAVPQRRDVLPQKIQTRKKKRSYVDSSFSGYGEGESDFEDAGARDDEDEADMRQKKRPRFGI